jgi:hypothetical protein
LFFQDILTEGDYFDKDRYRLGAKLSIQKDDVQAVLPITKVRKKNTRKVLFCISDLDRLKPLLAGLMITKVRKKIKKHFFFVLHVMTVRQTTM